MMTQDQVNTLAMNVFKLFLGGLDDQENARQQLADAATMEGGSDAVWWIGETAEYLMSCAKSVVEEAS
jgi:hypothetical protein